MLRGVRLALRYLLRALGYTVATMGTTVQLDTPHTIVGVMPDGFDCPRGTDFWTPVVPIRLVAAIVGTRGIRSLLFGVGALDVTTYGAVIALVFAVVAVAVYLPARRAAEVDPLTVLRGE